jgi:predicted phosphodiesterase
MADGTPWDNTEYVFTGVDEATVRRLLQEAKAEVLILGHTHTPMHITLDAGHILNPGSLYGNRPDLQRTCGILTLPDVEFEVFDVSSGEAVEPELRRVR